MRKVLFQNQVGPLALLLFLLCLSYACKEKEQHSSRLPTRRVLIGVASGDSLYTTTTFPAAFALLDSGLTSPIDEQLVRIVLDSLKSPVLATRILQAKAVSSIWPRCDGALAEAVSVSSFNYVQQKPVEFFALFSTDIPWQELSFWSDMIAQELITEDESDPSDAAKVFMTGLNERAVQQGADIHIEVARMERQVLSRIAELSESNEHR